MKSQSPGHLRFLKQSDRVKSFWDGSRKSLWVIPALWLNGGSKSGSNTTGHELCALFSRRMLIYTAYFILDKLEKKF